MKLYWADEATLQSPCPALAMREAWLCRSIILDRLGDMQRGKCSDLPFGGREQAGRQVTSISTTVAMLQMATYQEACFNSFK